MCRYIDADALDDTVQRLNDQGWHITRIDYKRIDNVLFEMPTADVVEVKHGKNISEDGFLCSVCTFGDFGGFHGYEPNFCPNCGADMRGGNNDGR